MKIMARVRFEKPQNREFLIQAFFGQNYSPKNRLCICDDKTAVVELEFDNEPPQMIIKAISHCFVDAMYNLEDEVTEKLAEEETPLEVTGTHIEPDVDGDKVNPAEDEPEEKPQALPEDENPADEDSDTKSDDASADSKEDAEPAFCEDPKQDAEPQETPTEENPDDGAPDAKADEAPEDVKPKKKAKKTDDGKPKVKRRYGKQKHSEDDYLDIPDFDAMASEVTCLTDFVTNVGKWLELSEDDINYFVRLMAELATIDVKPYEISDENVRNANLNVSHHEHKRFKFGKLVAAQLEKHNIYATILPFICTVMKYAKQIGEAPKVDAGDAKSEPEEPGNGEASCYMNCESFVTILNGIDKDLPVAEKVKKLLSEMGLDKKNRIVYNNACQIVEAAFRMETFESIDEVMLNAGLDASTKKGMDAKLKFSEWINEYNKANHVKRMKVIAFLRELKTIFHT